MLVVFDTCREFLRTVPVLQHDARRPEDLDTTAEDHIADETRYACMARAWQPTPPPAPEPEPAPPPSLDWDWDRLRAEAEARNLNWKTM